MAQTSMFHGPSRLLILALILGLTLVKLFMIMSPHYYQSVPAIVSIESTASDLVVATETSTDVATSFDDIDEIAINDKIVATPA